MLSAGLFLTFPSLIGMVDVTFAGLIRIRAPITGFTLLVCGGWYAMLFAWSATDVFKLARACYGLYGTRKGVKLLLFVTKARLGSGGNTAS